MSEATPPSANDAEASDRTVLRWTLRQARPFAGRLTLSALLSFASTPLALLQPVPLAIVVDHAVGERPLGGWLAALLPRYIESSPMRTLVFAATLQVLVVLMNDLQSMATQYLTTATGEAMSLQVKSRLMDHVQRLSFSFHDRKGTAESIYRIQYDAGAVRSILFDSLLPLLTAFVMFVSILVVILRINGALALVALAVTPILIALSANYRRRVRPRYRELKRIESSALRVVQEALGSFRVVKAFGRESYETNRFVSRASAGVDARLRLTVREGLFGLSVNLTTAIGTAVVLYVGGRSVRSGTMTVGELLLVIGYLAQLYGPLQSISKRVAGMQNYLTSAHRVHELLAEAPDVIDRPGARRLNRCGGHFELQQVSFGYSSDKLILRDVTLTVPAGSRVGIAGSTGAGKSTLVSLINRSYDPMSGRILLDGIDLKDYKLSDLRNQFAIVLQEPVLFATSIAENIRYARPWATDQQVIEAATAAGAHDFISHLDEGYESLVGERGMTLSGGERQRISLARAFLKNAPVLILDEPTSSVDTETERKIMEAMNDLMMGRTTFMIAHRLSTLDGCDIRLEVTGGRLVRRVEKKAI